MNQSSAITRRLARAQETAAVERKVTYRIYTEDYPNVGALASRYFAGFTILEGVGSWYRQSENAVIVEVIGTRADLQSVVHLAGDIAQVNGQESVLVTHSDVNVLWIRGND